MFFVFLTLVGLAQTPNLDALGDVLQKAQAYAARYEDQLGALISTEEYFQTAVWTGLPAASSTKGRPASRTQKRKLYSDFLLVRFGSNWVGSRNVQLVDGKRVETWKKDFAGYFAGSADVLRQLDNIDRENAQYNIGDFVRTFNLPTFPLKIMRNMDRFVFEKGLERSIDNVRTWEIRFSEVARPTLLRGLKGEDRALRGRLWIDPNTGKILNTEIIVAANDSGTAYQATVNITYKPDAKMGMLVPASMEEHYKSGSHLVDGLAKYSNFRRFEVGVKLDIGP